LLFVYCCYLGVQGERSCDARQGRHRCFCFTAEQEEEEEAAEWREKQQQKGRAELRERKQKTLSKRWWFWNARRLTVRFLSPPASRPLESSSVQSTAAVFLCARAFFKILLAKFYKVAKMRNSKFKKSKIK
jgi:hypothetical protein